MNVCIDKISVVSFGKLKNAVVTPSSGVNILSAPNESGKTTLASFIKFVFYGFAGTRNHGITDNERKLYSPWSGEVSEGSVDITADGTRYIVRRVCPPSGKETVEVVNRATGKNEFVGAIPGEVFFGVSEELFAKTLFFKQLTLPQTKDELIAERLRNISISADEQVGTKKAVERLKDCKNELVGKAGKGIVPALIRERDAIEETVTASADNRRTIDRLRAENKNRNRVLSENTEKTALLESERENIEKYEAYIRLNNINRLAAEEKLAKGEYESASSALKKCGDNEELAYLTAVNTELFAEKRNLLNLEKTLSESEKEVTDIKKRLDDCDIEKAKTARDAIKRGKNLFKIFCAVALLLLVASVVLTLTVSNTVGIAVVMAGVVLAFFGATLNKSPKKLGFESLEEIEKIISEYPSLKASLDSAVKRKESAENAVRVSKNKCAELSNDIESAISDFVGETEIENTSEMIEKIRVLSADIAKKRAVYESKKSELDNAVSGVDIEALAEKAKGAAEPMRERSVVDRELKFYAGQRATLSELIRASELEIASLEGSCGDTATLIGKRDSLENTINSLTVKHKAYETAIKFIEESSDHMKSMAAPIIGARADEYFSAATGGKYTGLEIDTRLSMTVGEDFRRSCDYLSAGTRDSAYLSLRLALAVLLFVGCGVPIIPDDAFVRIDAERLENMALAVGKAAEKHQIFIFTHGSREADAFANSGVAYSEISIKTD